MENEPRVSEPEGQEHTHPENDMNGLIFRVGSRTSQLALIQKEWVISELKRIYPEHTFQIVHFTTQGDKILNVALSKIGEKSLFTRELESALLEKEIHFAVHSLKDLPTQLPEGLTVAAITRREDPRDIVIFNDKFTGMTLKSLPEGSQIGTSSLRRIAQLQRNFPHLKFIDIRGNLNTRLKKLDDTDGPYAAIILAAAGVQRLGWNKRIGQFLCWEECMPAVGQGALAVECCSSETRVVDLLKPLIDPETYFACVAERAFLRTLEGGCSVPVAASTQMSSTSPRILHMRGSVWSLDGSSSVYNQMNANLQDESESDSNSGQDCFTTSVYKYDDFQNYHSNAFMSAARLGTQLGQFLLQKGAKIILDEIKIAKSSS